jgi:hypothetical protein
MNVRKILIPAAVIGVLFAGSAVLTASASPVEPSYTASALANSVTSSTIKDGEVKSADIGNAQVFGKHFSPAMIAWFTTVYNGSVHEIGLDPALQAKVNAQPTLLSVHCDAMPIALIGGSFKANKTDLSCALTVPAGRWKLDLSAFFHTTAAGPEGTRPQMAARVGSSATAFGDDYGTVFPGTAATIADREITGSATKVVTVTAPTEVKLYAFGYNDDTSANGGGRIEASADFTALKVG